MSIHQYLGKLGRLLPALTEWEWDNIFKFLDYFISIESDGKTVIPSVQWPKVKEILEIIEKIKH